MFDKLNLRIVANMEVVEMEVDYTLLKVIRKGQLEDERIQEIKHNIKRSHPDLRKVTKVCCGTKEGFVCLMSRNWRIRYFERFTIPLISFILEGIRCTKISRQPIGGTGWSEKLLSMLPFVTTIRESRPSINDPLDCSNPCEYLSESEKRLLQIS
jgi:hypothetical protein